MANSIFVGATAPVNFAASVDSANIRWAGVPVTVTNVHFQVIADGVYDIKASCSDGSVRKLRIKKDALSTSQLERARLQARILQDAVHSKTPLLFAVVGNNSVKHWFCDFTDDFTEIETQRVICPF